MLLFILSKLIRTSMRKDNNNYWPNVTLIIAAYNEEKSIEKKIINTFDLDYPIDKLQIIIASDGSIDRTCEIVKKYSDKILLVESHNRRGKSYIQNLAIAQANGEIVVFSDSPTIYRNNALKKLVRHFIDNEIGVVTGHVHYKNSTNTTTSQSESLYWKYETFIRKMESNLGILAMGSGCILAIRRELFSILNENTGEDFVLPLKAVASDYRVIYDKEAIADEISADNAYDLFRTKVRIISKDIYGLMLNRNLLNPFRYPFISISLFSHKLLRWLVPFFMILILFLNLFLLNHHIYQIFLLVQCFFYVAAIIGISNNSKIFSLPYNFCIVNIASLVGIFTFIRGNTSGIWLPQRR